MYPNRFLKTALAVLAIVLPYSFLNAQECVRAGLFSSPKGLGVRALVPRGDGRSTTLTIYADQTGIIRGLTTAPGIKFNCSGERTLGAADIGDGRISLFAGPGISLGYAQDYEKGYFVGNTRLEKNPGMLLAASGNIGCLADFGGRLSLMLSFTAEAGIHLRSDERHPQKSLTFYKNGFFQTFYPEAVILYGFGAQKRQGAREAAQRRFRFGIGWGGAVKFFQSYDFQYFNGDKSYVIDRGFDFGTHFNGYVSASAGLNLGDFWALSLSAGYAGISDGRRIFPLELSATLYPSGFRERGLLFTTSAGAALPEKDATRTAFTGGIGTGYHIPIDATTGMDFIIGLRATSDHPDILDDADGKVVDRSRIRRNDAWYGAVSFGIALSF